MNRRISVPDLRRFVFRRFARNRRGSTSVEFAFVMVGLMVVSLGIVDFTLLMFDYARAAEATRRGARMAVIAPPVGNLDTVATAPVTCTHTGMATSCDGGAVANGGTFDDVVAEMRQIYADIGPENVEIVYSASGIGVAGAGGYKPHVAVRLANFQRPFHALQAVSGVSPSITLPSFSTTLLGNSYQPAGS